MISTALHRIKRTAKALRSRVRLRPRRLPDPHRGATLLGIDQLERQIDQWAGTGPIEAEMRRRGMAA